MHQSRIDDRATFSSILSHLQRPTESKQSRESEELSLEEKQRAKNLKRIQDQVDFRHSELLESFMQSLREESRNSHNKVDISGELQLTLKTPGASTAPPSKFIDNTRDFHEASFKFIALSSRFRPESTESLCNYFLWLMNEPYPDRVKRVFHRAFKAKYAKSSDWFKESQSLPMELLQILLSPAPYSAYPKGNGEGGPQPSPFKRRRGGNSPKAPKRPRRTTPRSPGRPSSPRSPRAQPKPQQGRKSIYDHATRAATECFSVSDPAHRCRKNCPFLHLCTKCKKAGRPQSSPPHTVGACPHP
jgi:hypothetical protein